MNNVSFGKVYIANQSMYNLKSLDRLTSYSNAENIKEKQKGVATTDYLISQFDTQEGSWKSDKEARLYKIDLIKKGQVLDSKIVSSEAYMSDSPASLLQFDA